MSHLLIPGGRLGYPDVPADLRMNQDILSTANSQLCRHEHKYQRRGDLLTDIIVIKIVIKTLTVFP